MGLAISVGACVGVGSVSSQWEALLQRMQLLMTREQGLHIPSFMK